MKNVEDIYPLSPVQESLFYHALSAPGSRVGYERNVTPFRGALDAEAFRASWQAIVDRHPALRTAFVYDGVEEPVQIVRTRAPLEIAGHDWRRFDEAEQRRRRAAFLAEDEERGFDLQRAPLMRIALLRLGEESYEFVWSFHHLVLDAWCRALLLEEVFTLYAARLQGQEARLPPCRPYRDYVAWVSSRDADAAESYWRNLLRGAEPGRFWLAPPPPERPSPAAQHRAEWNSDPALSDRLRSFAQSRGLTLGTLVQAAWAILASRYGGRREVLFGVTVSGRPADLPGAESIVGVFINNLPVPVRVDPERELSPWLGELQRRLAEIRQYEYSSQAQILDWSDSAKGRRLFDTLVLFQNYPVADFSAADPSAADLSTGPSPRPFEIGEQDFRLATAYPITVWGAVGRTLSLAIYADGERFSRAAAERLSSHLRTLLSAMAEDPDALLGELPMLSAAERGEVSGEEPADAVAGEAPAAGAEMPLAEIAPGVFWPDPERLLPLPGPAPWAPGLGPAEILILGGDGRVLPPGVSGELCLGGPGLAPPAPSAGEAAIRYSPDPRTGRGGARLWHSRLWARRLDAGRIELLGGEVPGPRLGRAPLARELEAAWRRCPGVREVAIRSSAAEGAQPLVALVMEGGEPPAEELDRPLRWLTSELPAAPRRVVLEKIPVTAGGAPDWAAIEEKAPVLELAKGGDPSAGQLEELLAGIWNELLGRSRTRPGENLFELGMNSLSATRFVSRVRDVLAVDLPLANLFDDPTVAGLARRIEHALGGAATPELPAIERSVAEGDPPLSFAQERLWFMQRLEPESSAYNIPRALRISGELSVPALRWALDEIRRRHEVLRTYFPEVDGAPVQRIEEPRPWPLPRVDLERLEKAGRDAEEERLARWSALRPFELEKGPLVRSFLLCLGEDRWVVLFNLHHIISDAWSTGALVREVSVLYQAGLLGRPSPLPELPIQYADFARWQRRYLAGEVLEAQRAYWQRRLAGAPQSPRLPADRPRARRTGLDGDFHHGVLGVELSESLRKLSQEHGTTLFMTLLAGFKVLLHRLTDEADVVVGTDVANRNRLEIESLIGFFVNNLVLRTDLGGDPPFAEVLARVRRESLGAFAHQDLPFDEVVRTLKPPREPGRTPLFQVLFVLQNAPSSSLELPGLELSSENYFSQSKFELALFVWETPQGLVGVWNYSTELFEASTIARWAESFRTLMASAAAHPEARLSELQIRDVAAQRDLDDRRQRRRASRIAQLRGVRSKPIPVPVSEPAETPSES